MSSLVHFPHWDDSPVGSMARCGCTSETSTASLAFPQMLVCPRWKVEEQRLQRIANVQEAGQGPPGEKVSLALVSAGEGVLSVVLQEAGAAVELAVLNLEADLSMEELQVGYKLDSLPL